MDTPKQQSLAPPPAAGMPYLRGLDGLRALAVLAVLLYHAELGVVGGYLGVESFFTLSGFLITTLLLYDVESHGHVRLREFWLRRARRLLPALFVLLAGTLALAAILLPDELASLTRDTLAALVYVTNWYQIASGQSYFDAAERPPLLQHLWSLAIEEQFYLLWPLLLAVALRFLRRRGAMLLTAAAALGSAALMWALYDPGADPSRIYYGTDTRASGLLIGAALALAWPRGRASLGRRAAGAALDILGLLALAGLLAAYALLHEQHPLVYRGGLQLVALATALVVAGATHPRARLLPRLLELPPLRWVGQRSYGIYLWHWPIFMLTRPGADMPLDGWPLQALRFALAVGVAALSYRFVEQPIRAGALGRLWSALRSRDHALAPAPRGVGRAAPLVAASVLALGVAYITANVAQAAVRGTLIESSQALPTLIADLPEEPDRAATRPVVSRPTATPTVEASTPQPPSAASTPAAPVFDAALAAQLQQVLDRTVEDGEIPGVVASVRLADGSTWTSASGLADPDTPMPMQPDTRVRIGSLSKMFTAVVVLQLVEEGKLGLDDPLATWFPDLVPAADTITVRQLLQHTSGLYDYLEDRTFLRNAYDEPGRAWRPEELVAYAASRPPSFAPGKQGAWDYSNTNYVILGMVIERVAGRPLNAEIRDRIIDPLGLGATYVLPADTVEGPQARGFSKSDDQTEVAMSFTFGSANIVTTIGDLRTFGDALLTGDLLREETRAQMQEFVDAKGQYGMPDLRYGLGMMANQLPLAVAKDAKQAATIPVIGHIGGFGGFRAALWYAPESDTLVALSLNQASTDPNDLATQLFGVLSGRR